MNAIVAGKIEKTSGAMIYKKIDDLYMGANFYKEFYVPATSYIYIRDYYNSRFLLSPKLMSNTGETCDILMQCQNGGVHLIIKEFTTGNEYGFSIEVDVKLSSLGDYGEISYGTLEIS